MSDNIRGLGVSAIAPPAYLDEFPKFVTFMQAYQEYLYREQGISQAEVESIDLHGTWLRNDFDKYNDTGMDVYSGTNTPYGRDMSVIGLMGVEGAGSESMNIMSRYLLESKFRATETIDEEIFETIDGMVFDSDDKVTAPIEMWFSALGLPDAMDSRADHEMFVRLLKYVYATKGSMHCTKLFFKLFFGESVDIIIPKEKLIVLDGIQSELDSDCRMRDDDLWQEYAYIVVVKNDVSEYRDMIDRFYLRYLHPSGFKPFFVKYGEQHYGS